MLRRVHLVRVARKSTYALVPVLWRSNTPPSVSSCYPHRDELSAGTSKCTGGSSGFTTDYTATALTGYTDKYTPELRIKTLPRAVPRAIIY